MAVVKNMIVRVGADLSGLTSGFKKGSAVTKSFSRQAAENIKSLSQSVSQMEHAYKSITQAASRMNLGTPISKQIATLEKKREKLEADAEKTASTIAHWAEIEPIGAQFKTDKACAELEALELKIREVSAQISELQSVSDLGKQLGLPDVSSKSLNKLQSEIIATKRELAHLSATAGTSGGWLKNVWTWIRSLGSGLKSSTSKMEGLVRSMRRLGIVSLGLRLTQAVFGELSSVVHQYVSENAALQAQVAALKSSFGQALAPAINVVTNALSALMPYIVGVSNAIGSLITNLAGAGWTTVTAGANAAAAAIGGAGGAQKEFNRTLQGFDEITKLDAKSSGGGGGGNTGTATTPTEGKLPSWMTGLTDKVQKAIEDGDWFGVGAAIAGSLNKGIDGQSGADVTIGTKIGGWINNGIAVSSGLISEFDWNKLGTEIQGGIVSAIASIDSAELSRALGGLIGGVAEALGASISGSPIVGALVGGLVGAKFGIKGAIIGALGGALVGAWPSITSYFKEYIANAQETYDIGEDVGLGIILGMCDAFVNIGGWINEKIVTPLVDGFKRTFKIHSPSTHPEITGIGKNIMLGVLNGVLEPLRDPVGWIKENIFTPLSEGFEKVFGDGGFVSGLFSGVQNVNGSAQVDVTAKLTRWKDELRNKTVAFQSNLTTWRDSLQNKIVSFRSNLTTWKDSLKDKIVSFQSNLTTWKDSLKNKAVTFQSNLTTWKDGLKNKVVSFQSNLTTWKDSLKDKIVSFQSNLTTWKDSLKDKTVSFQSNLTTWKDSLKDKCVVFQSNLTTWKDNLKNKALEFGANVVKGWSGRLEDVLGISTLTTKLNVEVPEVKVKWETSYAEPGNSHSASVKSPIYQVAWNATGAILKGAQLFGRVGSTWLGGGEAGREAVLPLDRNTWWMDKIAERVALKVVGGGQNGNLDITINLVVDGKVLASTVVRNVNAQARATGRHPFAAYI